MNRRLVPLVLVACLVAGGAACGGGREDQPPVEVRIGVVALADAERRDFGGEVPTVDAARLAVSQANEVGALSARRRRLHFQLVVADAQETPESAVEAAQQLVSRDEVVAFVGPQSSRQAIAVAEVAEKAGVPMISPLSTNPATTAGKKFAFRVAFLDDFQGRVLARVAVDQLGALTGAVLYDVSSPYNKTLAEVFSACFAEFGGTIVATETYTAGTTDFNPQLERIKATAPDVLFLPNYVADVVPQVEQAKAEGIDAKLLGGDAWDIVTFPTRPEFQGATFTTHWYEGVDSAPSRAFTEEYREAYGRAPDVVAATTFDAVGLLVAAVDAAGSTDPTRIQEALATLDDFPGVTGDISYENSGDPTKPVFVLTIGDGGFSSSRAVMP
ncbi:MAG: ABC transporter substrate-binding protein [Acidimicrobiia bacterium]|nr:ABC transporter substrate-binding protein [Acidimicrobiia bacterium]